MIKSVIFVVALCVAVLCQEPPPNASSSPPMNRIARQAPDISAMSGMPQGGGGQAGNMGMQGLGNIPDPTAVIKKMQEVGSQIASGRRRRGAPPPPPPMPEGVPPPPIPEPPRR